MRAITAIMACVLFWGCQSQQTSNKETTAQDQTISFPLPDGFMGRGIENAYVVYSDSVAQHNGHRVSTIKAINPEKFATILSYLKPEKCIGQRIKYTAWVRSKDVANWAGLWLRIDPANPSANGTLGFDNMHKRPITGTKDWTKYEIVMDVPEGANNIVYGALLDGNGQIWVDSMDIQITDRSTPRTDTFGSRPTKVL